MPKDLRTEIDRDRMLRGMITSIILTLSAQEKKLAQCAKELNAGKQLIGEFIDFAAQDPDYEPDGVLENDLVNRLDYSEWVANKLFDYIDIGLQEFRAYMKQIPSIEELNDPTNDLF